MKLIATQLRKLIRSFLICTVLLLFFASFYHQPAVQPREVMFKMFTSIDRINSLSFRLKKKERVDGKLMFGEQEVKFNRQPKKIYTKILAPNAGVELLYIDGKNDNKAYLNPNGFPYTNLSFSPYSATMRKGNHHTIHEVGFDYIKAIIENIAVKSEKNFDQIFALEGKVMFDNKLCYKINIDNNTYKQTTYTVKKGETLTSIAYKLLLSDYKLLLMNPSIKDYTDVVEGQEIKITTSYAPKTTLYVDVATFLPLVQIISDEKGIFEQYEFHHLKLDPFFQPDEFSKEYEGYHF
jgi:outer membrane lipoprotein-sorting protein